MLIIIGMTYGYACSLFNNTHFLFQVFYVRGGQIKAANKKFSSINNDYEMTFSSETLVEPCHEESVDSIPTQKFNFIKFDQLNDLPKDGLIGRQLYNYVKLCEIFVIK